MVQRDCATEQVGFWLSPWPSAVDRENDLIAVSLADLDTFDADAELVVDRRQSAAW